MRPGRLQRVASLGPILEVNLTYLKQAATSQSDPGCVKTHFLVRFSAQ
jgi:hypothetical protein